MLSFSSDTPVAIKLYELSTISILLLSAIYVLDDALSIINVGDYLVNIALYVFLIGPVITIPTSVFILTKYRMYRFMCYLALSIVHCLLVVFVLFVLSNSQV